MNIPVPPALFIGMTCPFLIEWSWPLVRNQLTIYVKVYFSDLSSIYLYVCLYTSTTLPFGLTTVALW